MKTFTIELPQPSGNVVVYTGVKLIGRQRERKVRHAGHWTQKLAPGLYAWYRSGRGLGSAPNGGVFIENSAALKFAPETSFGVTKAEDMTTPFQVWNTVTANLGGIAERRLPAGASTEIVLPKDSAAALKRLGESFESGAEAGRALANAIAVIKREGQ